MNDHKLMNLYPPSSLRQRTSTHLILLLLSFFFLGSCSLHRGKSGIRDASLLKRPAAKKSIASALDLPQRNMNSKTGIYTLENGGQSLLARLWLFDHAQKTIDIQYYSFAKDVTGLIVSDYIVRAADEGVKVRVLIDDAASRMRSHEIRLLDSHDNIEIRVYNAGLMLGRLDRRLLKLAKNSNRLLRRMHNKTLTIDGQVSITGGRNIADEYFDFDKRYNFRDRDVMLMGEEVADVTKSFDQFWNDGLTVPYSDLSGRKGKRAYNDSARFRKLHHDASKSFSVGMREKVSAFPELLKAAETSGELVWVNAVAFVSDEPGKNEDKSKREGGICTDSLASLFRQARSSIDIQSPYFITNDSVKQLIRETIARGVKIRLLTNSLGSTDNLEAFSGYQRDRQQILEAGVEIYEFKPDAEVRYKRMIPEVQKGLKYKPVYGLHSKSMVIDGRITVIGSYNIDPRSANYNTECITIIRSVQVSENLSKYIEEEFLPVNSTRTTEDSNPDSKAGIIKRAKAMTRMIIPRKVL